MKYSGVTSRERTRHVESGFCKEGFFFYSADEKESNKRDDAEPRETLTDGFTHLFLNHNLGEYLIATGHGVSINFG